MSNPPASCPDKSLLSERAISSGNLVKACLQNIQGNQILELIGGRVLGQPSLVVQAGGI
jgi:hypothetical protein